jgi:putative transposase
MDERDKKRDEQKALFRYGVIADLTHLPPGSEGLYEKLKEKAEKDYCIPGTTRTRVAMETIRDWLKTYRKQGFEGLMPKARQDAGQSRALPQEVADLLVNLKEENPEWTVQLVIQQALASEKVPAEVKLAPTTVHRLLGRHGLMRKAGGKVEADRRRFAYQKAGELWMSDVMHGPAVRVDGKVKRKTYLIAFLDDATRVVPYATFALMENAAAFMPVFKQALLRRGVPKRLYVDNGAAYRSHHLAVVCAKLGITLIHARPYQPEGKGKQERWFRSVRMQLLPLLTEGDTQSLEALNRRLWAYVEGEYHCAPHHGLEGQTPLDKWAQSADEVRVLGPDFDLDDSFLFEAKRKVQKDRTVSLNGQVYEVDASLVGSTLTLRFDPSRPGRPIQVWAGGKRGQDAKVVNAYANCFVKRDRPSRTLTPSDTPPPPPKGLSFSSMAPDDDSDEEGR